MTEKSALSRMIQQLLGDTSDNPPPPSLAGDRRFTPRYSQHYPHANRLYRKVF